MRLLMRLFVTNMPSLTPTLKEKATGFSKAARSGVGQLSPKAL